MIPLQSWNIYPQPIDVPCARTKSGTVIIAENAKQYLKEHPEITDEVETNLRELYGIGAAESAPDTSEN